MEISCLKEAINFLKSIAAAGVGLMAAYFLTDMLYDNGKKEAENEVLETPVLPEKQAEVENTLIDTAIIEPKPSIVKSPVDSASFSKERVAVVKTKKKKFPLSQVRLVYQRGRMK